MSSLYISKIQVIFFTFIQNLQTAVAWVIIEIHITEVTPNHRKNEGWKPTKFLTKMC